MHYKKLPDVLNELNTSERGLNSSEADKRLEEYGPNELVKEKPPSPIILFINQFKSILVLVLLFGAILSYLLGHEIDAYVIFAILIINAILGFVQEYRAEKAIDALKKMLSPHAIVLRNGKETEIDARKLVPGDIILIDEGSSIPADARLIKSNMLRTQEAALTGESLPVSKDAKIKLEKDIPIAERLNMIFSGTMVIRGKGMAVVTNTGMKTELGKIAGMIHTLKREETPLTKELSKLGRFLVFLTVAVTIAIFVAGIIGGENLTDMLLASIALAVAAVPEGLPAVVTIALALGVQRMAKRNALMRRLPTVETLGSCNVICTDKTGTLTHNEMTVKRIFVNGKIISVTGSGYSPEGNFSSDPKTFEIILKIGALCNNARIDRKESGWSIMGDPTEGALLVASSKAGITRESLEKNYERIDEIPFSSERKMMTTVYKVDGKKYGYVKGAAEVLVNHCSKVYRDGKEMNLSEKDRNEILKMNELFAKDGLRVLGFAYKEVHSEVSEKNLVFVGLQAMIDTPRPEAKEAVERCRLAGIKTVMVTGDHKATAQAVAKELGITGKVITGVELEKINLDENVQDISIYARVNPDHKLKIIEAWKKKGAIVAMTGDGVNDAPALKKADIGIAMGITGTDVSKEAADMILTDDNFASIVNSVEEGRGIFDNVKKFVFYLLSSNTGEISTVFLAMMMGLSLPVTAIQILWINLTTDGLPALALGVDTPSKDVMKRPPRKKEEGILTWDSMMGILLIGVIMAIGTLWIFNLYNNSEGLDYARTMAFTTLMMFQMFNVLNAKAQNQSILKNISNKWLLIAIVVSILLQFAVIYSPLSEFFGTVPLTLLDWGYAVGVSSSVLIIAELAKIVWKVGKK